MEGEKNHIQPLCTSGCGFFANPATDGLCSQCYKAFMKIPNPSPNPNTLTPVTMSTGVMTSAKTVSAQEVPAAAKPTVPQCRTIQDELEEKTMEATGSESPSCSVDLDDSNMAVTKKVEKFKKNRCVTCRKKVGLTGFECRCGGLYCALHRYSDKHACRFDYKELGAQEIRRNNPVVVREKVQKI